jgi:hypothetical protein
MEPEDEPRPCHHRLAVYAQKSTPEIRLQKKQNHTVRDLASELSRRFDEHGVGVVDRCRFQRKGRACFW